MQKVFIKPAKPDKCFDKKQLSMGIREEMEHTTSKPLAKIIAKHHLQERKDYYTMLKRMGLIDTAPKHNPGGSKLRYSENTRLAMVLFKKRQGQTITPKDAITFHLLWPKAGPSDKDLIKLMVDDMIRQQAGQNPKRNPGYNLYTLYVREPGGVWYFKQKFSIKEKAITTAHHCEMTRREEAKVTGPNGIIYQTRPFKDPSGMAMNPKKGENQYVVKLWLKNTTSWTTHSRFNNIQNAIDTAKTLTDKGERPRVYYKGNVVWNYMTSKPLYNKPKKGGRMEGYCVKCKAKKEITQGKEVKMKNGRGAIKGKCGTCGTGMYRILGK